jgi:hypothetical protein
MGIEPINLKQKNKINKNNHIFITIKPLERMNCILLLDNSPQQ